MQHRPRLATYSFALKLALALVAPLSLTTLCAQAAPATAADAKSRIDIPAEDLGKALRDLGLQANYNISYDPTTVANLHATALKGDFTIAEALSRLLAGTRLRAVNINENTVQIVTAALASTADDGQFPGLEEIIVTGTNISGVENKTIPLLTFDKDAIERSGYATLADFITALPQNVKSGNNSADGILAGGNGYINNLENSTAANLRGLGASSTLTLINGHRVAPAAFGTGVDLSMIPLSAVERVDVLTDGSSAVYGSDAVGGVVNVMLRKDFDGQETRARLDTLSRGGGELKQIGQSIGRTWSAGGALAVFQFEDSNAIHADQRSVTQNLAQPTDVLPSAKRYSGVLTAHQDVGSSLEVFLDALLEHNAGGRALSFAGSPPLTQIIDNATDSGSANVGLRWQPFGDWHVEANGLFSRVNTLQREDFTPAEPPYVNGAPYDRVIETIKEVDLKLDGTLWANSGSSIKAAVGASTREEQFSAQALYATLGQNNSRHVHAAFAEFYAPLISSTNARPFLQRLELSAAVRDDSYSDFGSKTNPRFGVFIAPTDQIGLRVAYSTSFRAPDPIEVFDAAGANRIFIETGFPQPGDPTGAAPALFFGNQTIRPESSRNLTAGLDFAPLALPNTRFSLNYYRIVYSDRIIIPPITLGVFLNQQVYGPLIRQFTNDAAVESFVAAIEPPQQLFDLTPGQTGLAGIRYGYSYGAVNATREKTEGLDFGARSVVNLSAANKLNLDFNATYLRDLQTTFCATCLTTDLANTYGEPLKLRLRASAGWSNGTLSSNAAVNFANGYSDTNLVPPGRIASFTTLDLNFGWLIHAAGTSVSLNVLNALNSDPPRTAPAFLGVAYDPTNADPRGRTVSLQIRQSW